MGSCHSWVSMTPVQPPLPFSIFPFYFILFYFPYHFPAVHSSQRFFREQDISFLFWLMTCLRAVQADLRLSMLCYHTSYQSICPRPVAYGSYKMFIRAASWFSFLLYNRESLRGLTICLEGAYRCWSSRLWVKFLLLSLTMRPDVRPSLGWGESKLSDAGTGIFLWVHITVLGARMRYWPILSWSLFAVNAHPVGAHPWGRIWNLRMAA